MDKIKFGKSTNVAIVDSNGKTNPYCGTENDSKSNYLTFNRWEHNGVRRIYANDYKRRCVGYIDCDSKQIEYTYSNNSYFETIKFFVKHYEF